MTMRLLAVGWLCLAAYEAFIRNNDADANAAAVISAVFWVGAEIVKEIRSRRRDEPSTTLTNGEA